MVRVQVDPLFNMVSFFLLALSFNPFFLVHSPYTSPRDLFCSVLFYPFGPSVADGKRSSDASEVA